MKRFLIVCLAAAAGAAAARMFDGAPPAAVAMSGAGGGGNCSSRNGDVNADGYIDISDAVTLLGSLFLGDPLHLAPLCKSQVPTGLPDTSQKECFDLSGQMIACDIFCPGQDGAYATGCPPEGRFTDNGDGTVTDNCTGLMWQQETADVNGDGQSTDQDVIIWCKALTYCENLSFAGHDDWRLPNIRELESIVEYGRFNPAIDPVFGVIPYWYWSSTPHAESPPYPWGILFIDGRVGHYPGYPHHVRAVRGGR